MGGKTDDSLLEAVTNWSPKKHWGNNGASISRSLETESCQIKYTLGHESSFVNQLGYYVFEF